MTKDEILIIKPQIPAKKDDLIVVYRNIKEQLELGNVVVLPFGYDILTAPKDVEIKLGNDSDEDKVIHNATFYICEAAKDGRIGISEDITRKLYNYAYKRGFEAGKKEGTIKVKEKIVYKNADEKFEFNGEI